MCCGELSVDEERRVTQFLASDFYMATKASVIPISSRDSLYGDIYIVDAIVIVAMMDDSVGESDYQSLENPH